MFENFDFDALDHPEFKEDAVREEIVFPLLRCLGYSATGPERIVRSRPLVHPFVKIGSKRHRVNIIPDYLLVVDERIGAVVDAKSPREPIVRSSHVEQAFSYAIHPEIRCRVYALCNGRDLAIYDIQAFEPILVVDTRAIDLSWDRLIQILSPNALRFPELQDFWRDYGIRLYTCSIHLPSKLLFRDLEVLGLQRASLSTATMYCGLSEDDIDYALSLDIDNAQLAMLLSGQEPVSRQAIETTLEYAPFVASFKKGFTIDAKCRIGQPTRSTSTHEAFVPFLVEELLRIGKAELR